MKRTPLQRKTPLQSRSEPKRVAQLKRAGMTNISQSNPGRTRSSKRSFAPASTPQRRKVHLQACAVCGSLPCDPAHLCPRSHGGCDDAECVIALCRGHHNLFDNGLFDLLPYLSGRGFEAELAHMQGHYGSPLDVIQRLSGLRWAPERQAA